LMPGCGLTTHYDSRYEISRDGGEMDIAKDNPAKDNPAKDNPTVEESRRAGTLEWQLRNVRFDDPVTLASFPLVRHLTSSAIQGYASKMSVYPGESIDLMVSMEPEGEYTIDFYRLGWYGGLGGRHMGQMGPYRGRTQPVPAMGMQRVRECTWEVSVTLTVPDDWESGVYLAKLSRAENLAYGVQSYITFVVKTRRRADLLFQVSDITWQAYNKWPGNDSVYTDGTPNVWYQGTEVRASFDRPYAKYCQILDAPLSLGSGEFLLWEYPMAFWLEEQGYDVAYCSNMDLHLDAEVLTRCKAFLSVGHDEYWSREMFENVIAARDAGMSIGFFSGNSVYWEIEFHESEVGGAPCRVFSRKRLFDGEEARLMGVTSYGPGYGDWVVTNPGHWIYEGMGVSEGDRLPGIIGWEFHGTPAEIPGLEVVAGSELFQGFKEPREPAHAAVVYPCERGNWVFNAGTIWWPEGLSNPPGHIPARLATNSVTVGSSPGTFGVQPMAQAITANVLERMIADSPRG